MSRLTPLSADVWNPVKACHLLNRAGFGVPDTLAVKLAGLSPEEAVNALVDYEQIPFSYPEPDFLAEPFNRGQYKRQMENVSEEEIRAQVQEKRREERLATAQLKSWWLQRMAQTPRPLEEKMALFWHGHFAVSAQKVKFSEYMHEYDTILRAHATGNYKALATTIGQSRAMLDYLDNRKSSKEHPNENWARELMELFTLGVGNYSEKDIKESARAFTGWAHNGEAFEYRMEEHDFGEKDFLGRNGKFDGWDILDIIFEQPVAAEFICRKLWAFFAYENPDAEIVQGLAATLRGNGYELKPVLKKMFLSEAFYDHRAMGTQVKSPAQLLVQLAHHLEMEQPPWGTMAQGLRGLGQDLYYPPNVKGWDGNRDWINANTLLLRYNLPLYLLEASQRVQKKEGAMMAPEGGQVMPVMEMLRPIDRAMAYDRDKVNVKMKEVHETLGGLPPKERRAYRERFQNATLAERRKIMHELGIQLPVNAEGLDTFFDSLNFSSAGDCVYQMASRLLVAPVTHEQRDTLLQAMGYADADTPLKPEELTAEKRRALIHLITSMAEYQLC